MQHNDLFNIVDKICDKAIDNFEKAARGYCIYSEENIYVLSFKMYNSFRIWFKCENNHFRWIIKPGDREIYLSESFKIECDEDYDISLKALDEEIRMRLPEKLLSSGGWKEKKEEEIVERKRRHNLDEKLKTLKSELIKHLKKDVTNIVIYNNGKEFRIEFLAYNYFPVSIGADCRGGFGCGILSEYYTGFWLSTQHWYDTADLDVFFSEIREALELRIPDKYLQSRCWLEKSETPDCDYAAKSPKQPQLNERDIHEFAERVKLYFGDRSADFIVESPATESGAVSFKISFTAYNYYIIDIKYSEDDFYWQIDLGGQYIRIGSGFFPTNTEEADNLLSRMKESIELRIPDEYLIAKGWR